MQVLLPTERIQERVRELAREIAADYHGRPVTFVGVLTGCLMFLADLVRHLDLPLRIAFLQASSYRGPATSPSALHIEPGLLPDLRGRHILLVDDILDTGHTLERVHAHVLSLGVASLRTGVLLRKLGRQEVVFEPNYCGFTIPNAFVVGYGLDFHDEFRHLPYIGVLPAPDGAMASAAAGGETASALQ